MRKIVKCNNADYTTLTEIWERSVRATHDFLSEAAIQEIKASLIPDYFPAVDLYAVSDNGTLAGFIGLHEDRIEMLFINSNCRGQGYGSTLIEFAKQRGATKVDVNEQNSYALAFYQSKGFKVAGRDETDDAGRPYPILHLSF
ncbi:MAG: GNAT family N-acetyltransferase [Muribaculaceae bacterium]|nr:GNAT family N-acetyltransferase [Muribaculaceae bacterium]